MLTILGITLIWMLGLFPDGFSKILRQNYMNYFRQSQGVTPSSVSSPPTSLFHQRRSPTSPASWWTSSIHQSWSSGDSSCWRASSIPSSSSSVCGDWRILAPGLYFVINTSSHGNWLSTNLRFNMMTLIILTWVGFFTLPLVYKNNQVGFTGCPLGRLWSSLKQFQPGALLILFSLKTLISSARLLWMTWLVRSTHRSPTSRRKWWESSPWRTWRRRSNHFSILLSKVTDSRVNFHSKGVCYL